MKKLIALIALITISLSAFSQTKDLCARGGFNFAKHRGDVFPYNKAKFGVNLGFTYDIELFNNLFFRPGLYFTMKGTRDQRLDNNGAWLKYYLNQNEIEFPLLIAYKIDINSTYAIDLQAGPYCGIGFCGHLKHRPGNFKQRYYQRHGMAKVKDSEYFKRLDIGVNFGAGVDISRLYVGVIYELGFLKIRDSKERVIKPNCLMFNVGYYL
ncbi:MAG: PorT family protein [Bacteroidales bacterium]|nr:PorT family protein [Bacteroidales bacterium]